MFWFFSVPDGKAVQTQVEQETHVAEPLTPSQDISEESTEAEAKAFIYFKESSNRLNAVNAQGCIGLGQDCNGVLHKECPDWQTNYQCQDAFWEKYMQKRYGSWAKAKAFWEAGVQINGKDVGNWW